MGGTRRVGAALAVALLLGLVTPEGAAAAGSRLAQVPPGEQQITVTNLTGPYGLPLEELRGINDRGQIIAQGATLAGVSGGVLWDNGTASFVAPWWAPWGAATWPWGISDDGQVVGDNLILGLVPMGIPVALPFRSFNGAWFDLPLPRPQYGIPRTAAKVNTQGQVIGTLDGTGAVWSGSQRVQPPPDVSSGPYQAMDLNNRGQVTLMYPPLNEAPARVVVWQIGGGATELDLDLAPGVVVRAADINDRGHVLVETYSFTAAGPEGRDYLWDGRNVSDLGARDIRQLGALNERDHVVTTVRTATGEPHAVLWRDGQMTDLGTLGDDPRSYALALNDRDEVVGFSEDVSGETTAFLWRDGQMIDLAAVAGPEARTARAGQINDRGQIIGYVSDADLVSRPVLWTIDTS